MSASTTGRSAPTGSGTPWSSRPAAARRSPATSGRPRTDPPQRPAVVITTGSVQAPETLYWGQAATLARARLRGAHLRRPGPGSLRHARRGARPAGERPGSGRRAVLRRDGGRARLPPLHPGASVRAAPELHLRHEPRGEAGPPRRGRPGRRLQPALQRWSTGAGSGSPATRSAPPPSPSSARRIRASTRSSPGTTSRPRTTGRSALPAARRRPQTRQTPPITKPALGISNDYGIVPLPLNYETTPGSSRLILIPTEGRRLQRLPGGQRGQRRAGDPRRLPRGVGVRSRLGHRSLAARLRHAARAAI